MAGVPEDGLSIAAIWMGGFKSIAPRRGHRLARLELEEIDDGFAPPRDADIGDLERLEPVDASGVC